MSIQVWSSAIFLSASAVRADIAAGRLRPGARLPPQRDFAYARGIAVSTASRVYAELARRAEARQRREERTLRLIDAAGDILLGTLALGYIAWAVWFTAACFFP